MDSGDFRHRLKASSDALLDWTQSYVKNKLASSINFLIVPNRKEFSEHLDEREKNQLKSLIHAENRYHTLDETVERLMVDGLVPLWINTEVYKSSKGFTTIELMVSRRLREVDLVKSKIGSCAPFSPKVPMPPWYKEGIKFNVNWKHQMRKRKYFARVWYLQERVRRIFR